MSLSQFDQLPPTKTRDVCTRKLIGQVYEVPLLMLIDNRVTHNFLYMNLVKAIGWPIEETFLLKVKLGDGFKVMSQGIFLKMVFNWRCDIWEVFNRRKISPTWF